MTNKEALEMVEKMCKICLSDKSKCAEAEKKEIEDYCQTATARELMVLVYCVGCSTNQYRGEDLDFIYTQIGKRWNQLVLEKREGKE